MNFLRIFNFIFILFYVGLCLPSAGQSNSNTNYQQTREEIIARTMSELQIEEYGAPQVKQPVLVLEKDIEEIPEQNSSIEISLPKNNDVYIGQKIREHVITSTMSEWQSKEDWDRDPPVFVVEQSFNEERSPLRPRFEANWRYSNDRSILMGEFWLPLVQCKEDSVLFCDIRIMGDDSENKEFNIGAGYREVLYDTILGDGIAGGMIWFDRRFTDRDFQFNQVTVGGEWLGEQYDLRMNGYFPIDKNKKYVQSNPNGTGVGFVGNQILVNTDQVVVEEVLPGIDFEVGSQLNFMNGITDSTRFFIGGYHFEGNYAEDITGVRTRIVSDIASDVQIGARFQHDDIRGSQTYVESTIRFPFGYKKKYKHEGLWSRLDESPERDIDVVSNEAVTDMGVNKTLLNATSGTTQNVVHVDNSAAAGGNGTIENPYNTLAAAESVATTNDMIYIHKGDGSTTGQNVGINLADSGQMLVGSGVDLVYSNDRFKTSSGMEVPGIIVAATTAPVITNGAGNGIDIIADDVYVAGVTVDGAASNGIYALNADNVVIEKVISNNNTSSGIYVETNAMSLSQITLTDNTVENNNLHGLFAYASGGGIFSVLNFTGNNATNNTSYGILAEANGVGSAIDAANFTNNKSDTNNQSGFLAWVRNSGNLGAVHFVNNSADNNAQHGYYSLAESNGTMGRINFNSNTADSNGSSGILARSLSGGGVDSFDFNTNNLTNNLDGIHILSGDAGSTIIMANVTGNTFTSNTNHGLYVHVVSDGDIGDVNITDNASMNNASNGFYALANGAGSTITTTNFTNNTADNNGSAGMFANTTSGGELVTVNFTTNTATGNSNYGIRAESNGVGSIITSANFTSNVVKNSIFGGFLAFVRNDGNFGTVDFTNNTADANGTYGYYAAISLGGDLGTANFTGNISKNNTNDGFYTTVSDVGSTLTAVNFTNNTTSQNFSNGIGIVVGSDGDITQTSLEGNTSISNTGSGISIDDDSAAGGIVADLGGGAFGSAGQNKVYGNTLQELFVDLDGAQLKAENNWWGSASGLTGAETLLEDASTVDATPFLTVDPD